MTTSEKRKSTEELAEEFDAQTRFELEFCRPKNRGKKLRVVVENPLSNLTQRPTLWPMVQFSDDTEVCDRIVFIRLFM
jgi:hypothetical protein